MKLHRFDSRTWVNTVWQALEKLPEDELDTEFVDDYKSAMAYIMEELGLEFDSHGNIAIEQDLSYDPERRGFYELAVSD